MNKKKKSGFRFVNLVQSVLSQMYVFFKIIKRRKKNDVNYSIIFPYLSHSIPHENNI